MQEKDHVWRSPISSLCVGRVVVPSPQFDRRMGEARHTILARRAHYPALPGLPLS